MNMFPCLADLVGNACNMVFILNYTPIVAYILMYIISVKQRFRGGPFGKWWGAMVFPS